MRYFSPFLLSIVLISSGYAQTRPKKTTTIELHETPVPASKIDSNTTTSNWSFLSLEACGVESFLKQYPNADGRGTIICILDDGVDVGVDGLLKTSEGKTKFIDVQDFSGTGDLTYEPAEKKGDDLYFGGKVVIKGLSKAGVSSSDGKYFYAQLTELRFQNGLGDLNFSGKEDDVFGVIVFQDKAGHYKAVVDGDGDGDISDEKPISTYREDHELFRFRAAKGAPKNDGRFLSGAVNIYPEEKRINLYFADGGHGTHVAGMAGGYRIDGQTGFNGLAPGAEMVALKFADNTMGGITISGSMKKAYEYVMKLAEESGKMVVANMSFGIGSEIEGQSVMDEWLDSALTAHPNVTVCISAGNDGPGLSNIGLPGSSRKVISSGAALPDDTGRDLYGLNMSKPVVWDFSSRGGELAKPDIVSPGTAISTVPDYVMGDRYNGTSMASPYTTGCCAVLISAMKQMFPEYTPDAYLVKRALQMGAMPIANLTPLDQGTGLINIPQAFQFLSSWYRNHTPPKEYIVEVKVPNAVKKGTAAFYRNGNYPRDGERTVFTIYPEAKKKTSSRESMLSFNAFDLKSDALWLKPVESSIYRRGEGSLSVAVAYDDAQLQKPGVYVGKVQAFPKGKASKKMAPEFELWNTVVIPHQLTPQNNFRVTLNGIAVRGGKLDREFIAVPPSTKALKITLTAPDSKGVADAVIIDNDGRTFASVNLKKNSDKPASIYLTGERIKRGVLEIVVKRGLGSDDEPTNIVNLQVEAFPLEVQMLSSRASANKDASASFELSNSSNAVYTLFADGGVLGYERYFDTIVTGTDEFRYTFKPHAGENHAEFYISMPREIFNQFTDIGLQILKPDGDAVINDAFDMHDLKTKVVFVGKDTTNYTLYFRGGYAVPSPSNSFKLTIRERREFTSEVSCRSTSPKMLLEASQTEPVSISSSQTLPELPEGYCFYGYLGLKAKNDDYMKIPVVFSK